MTSGTWNKYWTGLTGTWSGPDTAGYSNYFGTPCDGAAYSWCSEWGLGGKYLATMPGQTGAQGESYAQGWSNGANWTIKINIGPTRMSACGF